MQDSNFPFSVVYVKKGVSKGSYLIRDAEELSALLAFLVPSEAHSFIKSTLLEGSSVEFTDVPVQLYRCAVPVRPNAGDFF